MQYISMIEYLGSNKLEELSPELVANANTLLPKINDLLQRFGQYRRCNSGYRSMEDHQRIYSEKNAQRAKQGLPPISVPMGSKHLVCAAIDLADMDGKLYDFCKANESLLEALGLWCEERQGGWQHLQIFPPKSGHRWFLP